MLAAVRAFLEKIVDYAGLFPPADLPFAQAIANYLNYRRQPESWMLGRFICPAARLKELSGFRADIAATGRLPLAVLGRGGKNAAEFLANLSLDLADIAGLAQNFGTDQAISETYEVKIPAEFFGGPPGGDRAEKMADFLRVVSDRLQGQVSMVFFECSWADPAIVDQFAQGLILAGDQQLGWKLRCGGLEPSAFPSPGQVARVLSKCCSAPSPHSLIQGKGQGEGAGGIPWKATAGLHHPLRHFNHELQTAMHGFINVFGAAMLAHARLLEDTELEAMLADEDASHFVFDQGGFSWKNHHITTESILQVRRRAITSFGSCSFDEPRDDLRRLDLI